MTPCGNLAYGVTLSSGWRYPNRWRHPEAWKLGYQHCSQLNIAAIDDLFPFCFRRIFGAYGTVGDVAVATALCVSVALPNRCGLGGGLFAISYDACVYTSFVACPRPSHVVQL